MKYIAITFILAFLSFNSHADNRWIDCNGCDNTRMRAEAMASFSSLDYQATNVVNFPRRKLTSYSLSCQSNANPMSLSGSSNEPQEAMLFHAATGTCQGTLSVREVANTPQDQEAFDAMLAAWDATDGFTKAIEIDANQFLELQRYQSAFNVAQSNLSMRQFQIVFYLIITNSLNTGQYLTYHGSRLTNATQINTKYVSFKFQASLNYKIKFPNDSYVMMNINHKREKAKIRELVDSENRPLPSPFTDRSQVNGLDYTYYGDYTNGLFMRDALQRAGHDIINHPGSGFVQRIACVEYGNATRCEVFWSHPP